MQAGCAFLGSAGRRPFCTREQHGRCLRERRLMSGKALGTGLFRVISSVLSEGAPRRRSLQKAYAFKPRTTIRAVWDLNFEQIVYGLLRPTVVATVGLRTDYSLNRRFLTIRVASHSIPDGMHQHHSTKTEAVPRRSRLIDCTRVPHLHDNATP